MNLEEFITQAISILRSGVCDRIEKGNVTIYKVGDNLIRVDIKERKE